ncbi:hypothetical protein G5B47_17345 [Paenibacillus sp. 7124]|uniref:Uncharacterized protein n=1 Tax=Paenibacillus apii TaxID=1850370 RepID=A0A6M1PQ52_9BACL|nr:hypothetical protein [Paenibacillus apii]NGM84182.1 hypothetical protein [Paenibacillus apii]NJJ38638.1 hypothetical protein [Paenibacillus apii]
MSLALGTSTTVLAETNDTAEMNHSEFMTMEGNHITEMESEPLTSPNSSAENNLLQTNTKNTTRIETSNPIQAAILTAQTIWPATHKEYCPGAVVLADVYDWQTSVVSAKLIHHPDDAPILLTSKGQMPDSTLNKIKLLNPKGNGKGTHIFIMGSALNNIPESLSGYKITRVPEAAPTAFAAKG